MYISAFLHKDELFEITNRWLSNKLESDDPLQITRIITYDSFVAWERLRLFVNDLSKFLPHLTVSKKIATKKELKDFICNAVDIGSERMRHIISEYRKLPEFYYVGSPIAALVYHDARGQITGMCRFKRVKRIAEKASRYASLHMAKQVHHTAVQLSEASGHPPDTSSKTLARAEKKHLLDIKAHGITLPAPIMTIKDVLGLKIIKNGISENQLEAELSRHDARIIEKEIHTGNYNAIHYVVELSVDHHDMAHRFKGRPRNGAYQYRGLPAHSLQADFERFLESGSHTVQVDLIFTTLDELIESEIGRAMHETRIFKQRQQQKDLGNITINIEYIIEYLLAVGMSPTVHIDEIPIKIWGRYLPDTLSFRIRQLYELPEYSIIDY